MQKAEMTWETEGGGRQPQQNSDGVGPMPPLFTGAWLKPQ